MLIVDEASMLDLELMVAILEAVPDSCSVVWIGDINQLPSIGAGMVLRDLINSKRVHVTVLDKIFRQAEGSLIIQNAHRIHRGENPVFPVKGSKADSYLIPVPKGTSNVSGKAVDNIDYVKANLKNIYGRLQSVYGFDPIRDIQMLTPMRVGQAGYLAFNPIIQDIVNPSSAKIEVNGQSFRLNDRVMQTLNDYDLDVFNGDVGFIKSIDTLARTLRIEFLGQTVDYPFSNVSNLVLSYACSVHKAQGSEFPVTILVLLSHHFVMLDRNIIYTANTRARKMAIYLSSKTAIDIAVKTQKVLNRNSLLALRLRNIVPKPG
jgi:exodeoxyribonuclease V alpha subunit